MKTYAVVTNDDMVIVNGNAEVFYESGVLWFKDDDGNMIDSFNSGYWKRVYRA